MHLLRTERRLARHWPWLLCLLAVAVGCSKRLATVNGTVRYARTPLTTGKVVFQPVGTGSTGYGAIGSNGSYSIHVGANPGIAPGDYLVTVSATEAPPPPRPGNPEPIPKSLLPVRYKDAVTSGLKFTVQSGSNRYDVDLEP